MLPAVLSSLFREGKSRFWTYAQVGLLGGAVSFSAALALDQQEVLRRHAAQEAADIPWVVFLQPRADRGFLEESIRALPGIQSIRFISPEEALEELQKDPVLSRGLTLTSGNPLPASFDVRWNAFFLRGDSLGHALQKVEALDGVDHVAHDRARVARLNTLQRQLYQLELVLVGLLWAGGFLALLAAGRLLFFPRGPLPAPRFFLCLLAGAGGGALGLAASRGLVTVFQPWAFLSGAVLGFLCFGLQDAFRDPLG